MNRQGFLKVSWAGSADSAHFSKNPEKVMKVLVLGAGDYRDPRTLEHYIYKGLVSLGYSVVQENASHWRRDNRRRDLEFVVTVGNGRKTQEAINVYRSMGVNVLIIDLGYIERAFKSHPNGNYQISLNQLNWVPPKNVGTDRLNALGVDVKSAIFRSDAPILLASQKFHDSQHGMDEEQMIKWTKETYEMIQAVSDLPVIHRPHPYSVFEIEGPEFQDPNEVPWPSPVSEIGTLVTFNSTVVVDALIEGIPTFVDSSSFYSEVCHTDLSTVGEAKAAPRGEREAFLSKLAAVQWSRKEIATGECFEFMRNYFE